MDADPATTTNTLEYITCSAFAKDMTPSLGITLVEDFASRAAQWLLQEVLTKTAEGKTCEVFGHILIRQGEDARYNLTFLTHYVEEKDLK